MDGRRLGRRRAVDLKSVPWQDNIGDYSDAEWATLQAAIHKRIRDGMARAVDHLDFE